MENEELKEGVLKVLFVPFVIAGLDSERSRTMTRNPLINSIIFLGGSGFRRNDEAFETAFLCFLFLKIVTSKALSLYLRSISESNNNLC